MEIEDKDGRVWLDTLTGDEWHDWGGFYWSGIKSLYENVSKIENCVKICPSWEMKNGVNDKYGKGKVG